MNLINASKPKSTSRWMHFRVCLSVVVILFTGARIQAQPSGGPYGPVYQSYEIPKEAKKIYYVAPDGKTENSGSALEAPTTLENAITKVNSGDAIVLRGGIYRTGNLKLNQGITLLPYKEEQPVLKGTFLASNWTKLRTKLWITRWDHLFPMAPASWWERTRQGMYTPLCKFNNDMVFVDGKFLQAVGWEGQVDENSYFIDYDNKMVYIGLDPAGKEVEITAFDVAIHRVDHDLHGKKSDKKGYTLKGIKFTQYAYRALEIDGYNPEEVSPESKHGKDVIGTTIENCEISFCSRVAAYLRGDQLTLKNNRVSDTSTEGIFILSSNDVLLENNIFLRNNIEGITGYFPAAVKIFNQCYRVTCNNNLVLDHPISNGIWYDVGNVDGIFTNNWMENVGTGEGQAPPGEIWPAMNGFFFEISKRAICAGNVFVNCNHGMMVLNSSGVKTYNNTFYNSMACFARSERSAEGDHFGWHPASGPGIEERHSHEFVNNLLYADETHSQPLLTVWQSKVICERATGSPFNQLDHNLYVRAKAAETNPVIWWAPANNERCRIPVHKPGELSVLYPGHESNSQYLNNYTAPVFLSSELNNFRLMPHFSPATAQAKLPEDIIRLISRKNKTGIGAYPFNIK